jgi:hypothetical protein
VIRINILTILTLTCLEVFSQIPDSLLLPVDSLLQTKFQAVDSIQRSTDQQFKSLKNEYDSIEHAYTSLSGSLQQKADSLSNIGLPSEKFASRIDSLITIKEQKLNTLKTKAEALKKKSLQKMEDLDLPREISQKVGDYTNSLNNFDIALPKPEIDFPALDIAGLSEAVVKTSLPTNINDLNVPQLLDDLKQAADNVKDIQQNISEVPSTETIAGKVEDKAGEIAAKKFGDLPTTPTGMTEVPADGEAAKKELVNQAQKQAVDHFDGKQEQLKSAMEKMSKYKKKYSSVQSIKDLPKKALNEMNDKPTMERVVPGISFQYQFRNSYMLDTYVYAGYRLTSKITTGIGWNQRFARDKDNSHWNQKAFVYGPRAFGNYRLGKGFMAHLEVESMNTFVPYSLTDPAIGQREWVWGTMTGLKKEYRITKQLRGTILVLYNMNDPRHRSPYIDRLNSRIGVEYRIKKKQNDRAKTGVH